MRNIGLHLRLYHSLTDLAERAIEHNLKIFQSFLFLESVKRYIKLRRSDVKNFLLLRRKYFNSLYLHGSYFVNFCSCNVEKHPLLEKELRLAERLEFTHIILHPGAYAVGGTKLEGIDNLAIFLNFLLKKENNIKILLENTAFAGRAVGSDLSDFFILLNKLDYPEKIGFCVDTAHAYAYGYDISTVEGLELFVDILKKNMILERIDVIHLNDTAEALGSKMDRHSVIGDGLIGMDALVRFANNPAIKDKPVLLEMPPLPFEKENNILMKVINLLNK